MVYAEEPPPQEEEPIVSARDAVAAGLSVIQGNLLHEQMLLDGGQEASWTVPMKAGAEYVIDVMCVGSGDLLLEAPGGLTTGVTCDGLISTTIVTAAGPSGAHRCAASRAIRSRPVIRVIEG